MAGIYVETKLRPCRIKYLGGKEVKALFHCWNFVSNVLSPPLVEGHSAAVVAGTSAIVELEDGSIKNVRPEQIVFEDTLFNDYVWRNKDDRL